MNTLPEFKTILQKDLSELMQTLNTKNELLEFADLFGLPYKQSLRKKALAEIIELKLLEHPEVLMNVLPKEELLSLQKLVHAGGYLKSKEELNVFELEYRTIVFRAKQNVIPTKVEDIYFEYALPGNLQRTLHTKIDKMVINPYVDAWDRKDRIFVGLLQLYGVLSQHQFFKLWKKTFS